MYTGYGFRTLRQGSGGLSPLSTTARHPARPRCNFLDRELTLDCPSLPLRPTPPKDPYRPLDFLDLDADLSEEALMVRDTVRSWVSERVMPEVAGHFEAGTFPRHLIAEMGELGILGCNLPEKYGCAGMDSTSYGIVNRELERADSGLRSFYSVQSSLAMWPILAFGSEEQKQEWLARLATGEAIGCFGLT